MARNPIYSNSWMHEICVEPVKRNKDGEKWIVHRFPIKDGISLREVMMADLSSRSVLVVESDIHGTPATFRGIPVIIG